MRGRSQVNQNQAINFVRCCILVRVINYKL